MPEEKIYTIPLRREWLKAPRYKRAKKAITTIKKFLFRHLKQEVKIGPFLNKQIFKRGPRNPPAKITVRIEKKEKILKAELINAPKEEAKEEKKKTTIEKLKEKISKKPETKKEKKEILKEAPPPKKQEKETKIIGKEHAHRKTEKIITEKTGKSKSKLD